MEQQESTPELKVPASHTVYIGQERYSLVHQLAIDVSSETRVQISPSLFVRHLIDNFSEQARANLIAGQHKSPADVATKR